MEVLIITNISSQIVDLMIYRSLVIKILWKYSWLLLFLLFWMNVPEYSLYAVRWHRPESYESLLTLLKIALHYRSMQWLLKEGEFWIQWQQFSSCNELWVFLLHDCCEGWSHCHSGSSSSAFPLVPSIFLFLLYFLSS